MFGLAVLLMLVPGAAHAWYGPICYSDRTTQLTLTIPSISGETPGDLKIDFDDNDGKVRLGVVRASASVKNAHEVQLVRDAESQNGVFAIVVTSPRSTTGYKFELEFRKDASECTGAIIKASDRGGAGLLAHGAPPAQSPASGMTLASAKLRAPRATKPKSAPSPLPAGESAATGVQVVNLDESSKPIGAGKGVETIELKPLPTPTAGSDAPAVHEQQAGEAPKSSEVSLSEPTAQPRDAGSEAPPAGSTEVAAPSE